MELIDFWNVIFFPITKNVPSSYMPQTNHEQYPAGLRPEDLLMAVSSTRLRWRQEQKVKTDDPPAPVSSDMKLMEFAFRMGQNSSGSRHAVEQPAFPALQLEDKRDTVSCPLFCGLEVSEIKCLIPEKWSGVSA